MKLFRKIQIKLVSFQTGTIGLKEHAEFIENLDKNRGRIIHAYTLYHDYSSSHVPMSLNYVVEYNYHRLCLLSIT